jgi:hypothetical protein
MVMKHRKVLIVHQFFFGYEIMEGKKPAHNEAVGKVFFGLAVHYI